ncbi:MAG TPA: carbohydrate ABC transporter permease [Candidatus Eisenbergiella intestinipullorum]|nr:carbohydrate ABC transporter permease [Candidatus Eisenbergiella intestinipullorum]
MKKNKKIFSKVLVYIILIGGAIICLIPFFWLVRSSFMKIEQIFLLPPEWIPRPFTFENYIEAFTLLPFGRYFFNTILIVGSVMAGTLITSSICAYGFSRIEWKGRNLIFSLILSSMMLPYAATLIPTFIGWSKLGAINTYFPLTVPAWFGGGAFNIFLLKQFFQGIPHELDESAVMDGAGHFTIYYKIILPLVKPALVVVALFTFMNTWNDFLAPLIYINDDSKFTLALGLQLFTSQYTAQWHLLMAAATVILLPVVIVFLIGQKYFIEGITMTGLKG